MVACIQEMDITPNVEDSSFLSQPLTSLVLQLLSNVQLAWDVEEAFTGGGASHFYFYKCQEKLSERYRVG